MQYQYTLQRLNVAVSTQDTNGDFQTNEPAWVLIGPCRNENGRQQKFNKEDGTYLQASHLIQCPAGTLPLKAGERIRVVEKDDTVRIEGEVIYAAKDRFHTRIWV